METPKTHSVTFRHDLVQGPAFEAGKAQGEALPEGFRRFFTAPHRGKGALSPQQAKEILDFFERRCPGLNEELAGCAQALGVPPERLAYYPFSYDPLPFSPGCSQAVVLPSHSADGHLRLARNYDFNHEMTELRLVTTRIEGRYAHLGFSEFLFGRYDGMNEKGLCVTMSAGAPMAPAEPKGCMFWSLVRTVLDRCATVQESLELVEGIPLSFNLNLVLADRSEAAVVEMASSHRAVRRAKEGVLAATNHFVHPEMRAWDLKRSWNSVERTRLIHRRGPGASREDLQTLLSEPFPAGLCAHDFTGYFGTLWSQVFDPAAGTVEICLGPGSHNPWRTFSLDTPAPAAYPALLPDAPVEEGFWRPLAPGEE